jgi:hypothetical protein
MKVKWLNNMLTASKNAGDEAAAAGGDHQLMASTAG